MTKTFQEYEHQAVPIAARKSLFSIAVIWSGFPMVMVGAFVGAQIINGLGFRHGMLAILLGNFLLAGYVAVLSAFAAKEGKSFGLSCRQLFGEWGGKLITFFLSGLVVGWFAVQTGLAGESVFKVLGLSQPAAILMVGGLFTLLATAGLRMLKPISIISIVLFIVTGGVSLGLNFQHHRLAEIIAYQPSHSTSMALGVGVTLAISVFIDSGTLTADFTRWSKSPTQAVIASLSAFPIANTIPMLLGGIVAASLTAKDGNFALLLNQLGPGYTLFAALFFVINCASVATHGLYNAAAGWGSLFNLPFQRLAVILGAVGTGLALAGITEFLVSWLSLLGIVVPGIGGAMIAWSLAGRGRFAPNALLISWGFSILCSALASVYAPQYSVAVIAIFSAFFAACLLLTCLPQKLATHEHMG
ncbi:purine-cytosine permease family protein [Rosenbergiella nectarea]|uniref:purine-cytosine permease family protein n=1 Tax=Rosenbergiella nectarea TaxID=988801 RepID=UPI001F4EDAFB|nr:cytosine permease [Rosenbergiella nectarea]